MSKRLLLIIAGFVVASLLGLTLYTKMHHSSHEEKTNPAFSAYINAYTSGIISSESIIGCRVSDGHLFELFVDEATSPSSWPSWEPDIVKLEDAIRTAFTRYRVVGFYADPARDWRSHVDSWEATYGSRTALAVTAGHPFEWWFSGGRSTLVERAVELFEGAVRNHDLSHAGEFRLTEHVLNARRRVVHSKLTLGKASDYSDRKIDACTAAVLAYQARVDAVAKGEPRVRKTAVIIRAR